MREPSPAPFWPALKTAPERPPPWYLSPDPQALVSLPLQVRAWDAFSGLDARVKDLLTSLRVVAELQNPAVRSRHWRQLMTATGVQFTMNEVTLPCSPSAANIYITFTLHLQYIYISHITLTFRPLSRR